MHKSIPNFFTMSSLYKAPQTQQPAVYLKHGTAYVLKHSSRQTAALSPVLQKQCHRKREVLTRYYLHRVSSAQCHLQSSTAHYLVLTVSFNADKCRTTQIFLYWEHCVPNAVSHEYLHCFQSYDPPPNQVPCPGDAGTQAVQEQPVWTAF